MKRWLTVGWAVIVTFLVLQGSGVVPAIVPQLVPTANKHGNSTVFQLSSGATSTDDCAKFDANGNIVTAGGICTTGGGGGTVNAATQFQVGEYLTSSNAISGVSIPNCTDTGGNHVNFASGTGVFTCGTSTSGVTSVAGLTGVVPGQGTDANILTSGTVSASTGVTLCTDANHGATTSGCTAGGVSSVAGLTGAVPGQGTDSNILTSGTVSGTAATLCTDANGGATTSGCSTTGYPPWLTMTDPTGVSFVWRNQGSATITTRTKSLYLAIPSSGGIIGREIGNPSTPWSITMGFTQLGQTTDSNNGFGLYISDGTKLEILFQYAPNNASPGTTVQRWTNTGTFSSTVVNRGSSFSPSPFFYKVFDDGTNITWYRSINGIDFDQISQYPRLTFLASVTHVGFGGFSNSVNGGMLLVSWVQGTS